MGMQVLSSVGATPAPSQLELNRERRPPLPAEKAAATRNEIHLLGSQRTSDLQTTASELERISLAFNRRLRFEIDHESKEIVVKVIDNETDKVIRELPPEELKRLHNNIRESIGVLFDQTV
jgi:flagellar protein FlaG